MLAASILLVSSCIIAQEPAKTKTPMQTPTKQAPSTTQDAAKPGSESKNNAVIFKGAGKNKTTRDADKAKGSKDNKTKTPKGVTQRDRPKDIPN